MPTRHVFVGGVIVALGLVGAGCGDDGGSDDGGSDDGDDGDANADDPSGQESNAFDGDAVPDACTLITSEELSELLEADQGTGQSASVDPTRSTCCTYTTTGTITAVEVADNYEATKQTIEQQGFEVQDVDGVGNAAFFQNAGSNVAQLVARGDEVFVAVTYSFDGDVDTAIDTGSEIANVMLETAEEDLAEG